MERTEDLEASIHVAESRLEQKDAQLRQKDLDRAELLEERERIDVEL